jgi:ABC-type nitrate/sulfonate/bicarbonate transport system substrate-binding protein
VNRLRIIEFVPAGLQVIAGELGLLDAAGVQIETTRTRSSTEQRAGLMDGTYDLGLTALDNLIAWDAGGDDLVVAGQVERTTVLDLCASADVAGFDDLRGRALAVDAVDNGFAIVLRRLLARHGVADGDYGLLPAGGIEQRMDAVVEGRAAAGLLGPPFNRMAMERGCHVLAHAHAEFGDLPGIGVVIRASAAPATRRAARAYLRALADAAAWATDDLEPEAVAMLERAGFDPDGAVQLFRIRARTVEPSREGIELLYEMRRELGMLPAGAPPADDLVQPLT